MSTPLNALIAALRKASDYDPRVEAPPEAVLWCDPNREFAPLLPALRRALPNLLTLGDYDPALRQGPAIWLRAAAGRAIPGLTWEGDAPGEGDAPAILYLPGVAREALRAAEDCPQHLRPLAWFVVGGAVFGHANSKDWTLRGFLGSKTAYGGLGLDVAEDEATRAALAAAAPKLFGIDLAELAGRRLDAPWLHALLVPDLAEDTLSWLDGTLTPGADPARFAAFQARAKAELKIDPAKAAKPTAAARLLRHQNGWAPVWERFAKSGPGFHEPLAALLGTIEPPDLLAADPAVYPSVNARKESELRAALAKLANPEEVPARQAVIRLAREHANRCDCPWAARGQARLAQAVQLLARLAETPPLAAQDAQSLASSYAAQGWQADDAALRALEAVASRNDPAAIGTLSEDRDAVVSALRALYAPRLEREASALQALAPGGLPSSPAPAATDAVLFIDGLRMDLAHRLAELLRSQGATVEPAWRWTGLPSVTATCKPLASPAAGRLRGADSAEGFEPLAQDGKCANHAVLMRELAALGWRTELTLDASEKCWIEAGHFDKDGHTQQARVADGIGAALHEAAAAALRLVRAGRRLRIATDHGWLLLPGGLPVANLPAGLAETRWRRCAIVKEGASATAAQLPWTWNRAVPIAIAPGAHVFVTGAEYAHGGISPQESVVPELIVSPLTAPRHAAIAEIEWSGLRLRLRASGGKGLLADLRLGADGEGPSIADKPRELDADGRTSLLVPDDTLQGRAALIELRDSEGNVIATHPTAVGA
ncbi:MAG: BREX-1 system phosphatase PglZ type B [Rhodospirillales bacterium]|nr:BREX-1 system phosphatase PglZ type B [Rhodospirillales bacterium]